ncbi:hypothetical protein AX14_013751 [Amanita brunnescens Koide BX004]|nr:hypothetical protein AX14_013751 [Amanita brunnescens Koide BX004]
MPPAKATKRTAGKKPAMSAKYIDVSSDAELPSQPIPPATSTSPIRPAKSSPGKHKTQEPKEIIELDDDDDAPAQSSLAKRKARTSKVVIADNNGSSPDASGADLSDIPLSRANKKLHLDSPYPTSPVAALAKNHKLVSPATPKRLRKMTEKALYMAGDKNSDFQSKSDGTAAQSSKSGSPDKKEASIQHKVDKEKLIDTGSAKDAVPDSDDEDAEDVGDNKVGGLRKSVRSKEKKRAQTPQEDSGLESNGDTMTAAKGNQVVNTSQKIVKNESEDEMCSVRAPSRSELLYPAEFRVPADSDYDDQEDFESVETEVMPLTLQDMKLRLDYTDLPLLRSVEMHSTSIHGNNHQLENYSPVWAALNTDDDPLGRRRFRKAIRFVSAPPFINPSRASPALVVREVDRIMLANRRQTAVFLTTGIVTECQLITPGYFGNTSTYLGRRICIYPFHTEHQRAAAYIGMALNHKKQYSGPLYNGALSFSTRKDTGSTSGVTSPTTARPGRSALTFRRGQGHTVTQPGNYPASLGFKEKVPIYDARGKSDFMFTAANLEQIAHLPLYKDGLADAPENSLVTIGYAVNEYMSTQCGPTASLNVLFVIIIGMVERDLLDDLSVVMAADD